MITLKFKSFQGRLLFYFLTLFSLILLASNIMVSIANSSNAHEIINDDLKTASKIFLRLLEIRKNQLEESARLLSGDYAFKAAFASRDEATIRSALVNHQARIGADMMMLVSTDRRLLASTTGIAPGDSAFKYPRLIDMAEEEGEAYTLLTVGSKVYQAVVTPLLAPVPVAWVLIGFKMSDETALDFKKLTNLEVSFCHHEGGAGLHCFASTLPGNGRETLFEIFKSGRTVGPAVAAMPLMWMVHLLGDWSTDHGDTETAEIPIMGDTFVSLKSIIGKTPDGSPAYAVVQRSLGGRMKPFLRVQRMLLGIAAIGMISATIAAILVSRSVSRPVTELVRGVQKVQEGDYTWHVNVAQEDELGTLGSAINQMTEGLGEKDRVRALLGKVVSPAIAEELLSKKVELGGEEREVTVLFSDIRSYTSHAEGRSPKEVISFLNVFLTRMSGIIEEEGGVVDKYIGDAIMALFGAPVPHQDDIDRALMSAIKMQRALEDMNRELKVVGGPHLDMGIGINSDRVVVGNVGSINRLNYTAIGDGVNLASRLQDLTKDANYGAKIIVSEHTLLMAHRSYKTRGLGSVKIKGKREVVSVYELIGEIPPDAQM